ncbi:hypothetical protein [Runella sp.]|uniref:hypothetical protein n=1 Tax=Runella sp. TaxID=1960881 RepID=UPI003D0FF9D1
MKRILFLFLLFAYSACAQTDIINEQTIRQLINQKFPTNSSKLITASDNRLVLQTMVTYLKNTDSLTVVEMKTLKDTTVAARNAATSSKNAASVSAANATSAQNTTLTYRNEVINAYNNLTTLGNFKGVWNASTNSPTLTTTPSALNDYYEVTVAGTQSITGSSVAFAVGDRVRSNGTAWVRVLPSSTALNRANTAQATSIFQGDVDTVVPLSSFLLDIQFTGLVANATDQIYVENVRRAKHYTTPTIFDRWLIRIAKNGTNVCTWFVDGYTEPAADAGGKRIATLSLVQEGSSGVSAVAIVDWSVLTTNTETQYTTTTDRLKSLLSPKKYIVSTFSDQKTQNLSTGGKLASTNVTIGSAGDIATELARMDITRLFKGPEVNSQLSKFLLDIQFTGLTVPAASSQVHLYNVWRAYPNPTTPRWVVDIAVYSGGTSTRFVQFVQDNYTEPTPDANGNIIETITLPAFGSSGVTATAKVNWAALTPGVQNIFAGSTRVNALLSEKAYMPTLPVAVDNTKVDRIDVNNLLSGTSHDAFMKDFLLDIIFDQDISPATGQTVHLNNVWRAYPNPGNSNIPRHAIDIAINDNRFVFWGANNYTEPTPDANGNIFDTITLSEISGSGKSGKIKVNWAKATSGVANIYSGSTRAKGALSPNAYNRRRLTPLVANTKSNLPSTTVPHRVYTVLNDVNPDNIVVNGETPIRQDLVRQYSLSLYVDRFLKSFSLNSEVRFNDTKTDKYRIFSPRKGDFDDFTDHPTPSQIIAKSVVIYGGSLYNNRTITFNQVSTRESAGADTLVKLCKIGDSTVYGIVMDVGVPDGFGHKSWGVIGEQYAKARVDYLLSQGYTAAQINAGSISAPHNTKHRYINIGTVDAVAAQDNFTLNYRGVTLSYSLKAEGRGGWTYNAYLNKPTQVARSQGSWDMLGLGNGSGTDYTGSAAQTYLFDRTAWTPANCVDTAPMRAFMLSAYGFTGTTLADYVAKMQALETDPTNPFYDKDKAATYTDTNGNVWTVRFSMTKYLSRWRTMDNSGTRLLTGNGSIGTKVGAKLATLDVTLPSHIIMQSCQNDGNIDHYGVTTWVFAKNIKAEYLANGWGRVNVGLSVIDGAGTYFPDLYPEVGSWASMNESLRAVHNDNLQRAIDANPNEDTNRVWVISNTHIIPTAKSIVYRRSNSPEYDLTLDEKDALFVPSRPSTGNKEHINSTGNRPVGINEYGWTRYTISF